MTNWKPQTHATSTVQRNENGDIQHVKVRAEYFKEDLDAHENDSERYAEGVSARFKFDVVHGGLAVLDGVKDIDDGASTGYDTSLKFLRTVPVAEEAVSNVPGIENVQEAEEQIMDALERGQEAVEQ